MGRAKRASAVRLRVSSGASSGGQKTGKVHARSSAWPQGRGASSLDADTQLGAFAPGADPTRSKAAYQPSRLVEQQIMMFICPGTGNNNIDFWRLWTEDLDFWWSADRKY